MTRAEQELGSRQVRLVSERLRSISRGHEPGHHRSRSRPRDLRFVPKCDRGGLRAPRSSRDGARRRGAKVHLRRLAPRPPDEGKERAARPRGAGIRIGKMVLPDLREPDAPLGAAEWRAAKAPRAALPLLLGRLGAGRLDEDDANAVRHGSRSMAVGLAAGDADPVSLLEGDGLAAVERHFHRAFEDDPDMTGLAPVRVNELRRELEQPQLVRARPLHLEPGAGGRRLPRKLVERDAHHRGSPWVTRGPSRLTRASPLTAKTPTEFPGKPIQRAAIGPGSDLTPEKKESISVAICFDRAS